MRYTFDYDPAAPLDVQEVGVNDRGGVEVHDISYANPNSTRVTAYLVLPAEDNRCASVIFLHGGGQDRSAFLNEASSLAEEGVVSLLIDVPFVRSLPNFTDPALDRDAFLQTVVGLRRGVDLLVSRVESGSRRVGYVGLSFSAWMGGLLSSVEKRIKAYVLIAGVPSYSEIWRSSGHPFAAQVRESLTEEQLERYVEMTAPLDAVHYVGSAAPSSLFFQFARHDETISEQEAMKYSHAGSEPKTVRWYEAGHEDIHLNPEALRDRVDWLRKEIRLVSPEREA